MPKFPVLLSEIDPVQNKAVQAAVSTAGFNETTVWSGQPGGCGNPSSSTYHTCYPPAVNYTPLYYMINGVAFNKTNANASLFAASNYIASPPAATATGTVLVRLVNAGVHMHVPSIAGSLTGTANAPRLLDHCRRWTSSAGPSPRAARSIHGSWQDVRRNDQRTRRRRHGHSGL